jgi:2-haloacid dehalogenase
MAAGWVLFDLNGTLVDPGAMTATWPGGRGVALSILDEAVAQAMVDTITGEFRQFPDYLRAALGHRAALAGLGEAAVEQGARAAQALPAFPDAAPALASLRAAGMHVGVLTNSAADSAGRTLEAAGLSEHVERVLGADAVGAYKPDRRLYEHALRELGVAAAGAWLVAGHWWDVTGAKRAGMRTAWVGRDEGTLLPGTPAPDVLAPELASAAQRILAAA